MNRARLASAGAAALLCAALLAGCATPASRFDADAAARGMRRIEIDGIGHRHVGFTTRPLRDADELHVYFDGDGTPFLDARHVAMDPTARDPLILRLMALDVAPAVLLGRPCYYNGAGACNAALWTEARYGEAVVASQAAALARLVAPRPSARVVLIGYSGGGALAMLVAAREPRVDAVVTIAANLDTRAWSLHHGMPPLAASLDPAALPVLPASVRQLHVAGAADARVPPALIRAEAARQQAAFRIVAGADHGCCWEAAWPEILREIAGP